MAAPVAAGGMGLKSVFDFVVNVRNSSALQKLSQNVLNFRSSLSGLGVTIIFVDRLIQSFSRAWARLNYLVGVSKLSEVAADFRKVAEFTGIGVERLQAFAIAGERVGMTLSDVQDLFSTLDEKVRDAMTEKGVASDFARFGMGADFFDGTRDAMERFQRFSDHWLKQNKLDRLAMGETFLGGDNSKKASKMLEGGVEGLRAAMKEAMASGRVLSDEQIQVAKSFSDSQRVFLATIGAIQHQVALVLMPLLTRLFDLFQEISKKVLDFVRTIAPRLLRFLSDGLDKQLDRIRNWMMWFDTNVKPIGETVVRMISGTLAGLAAIWTLGNFKLIPFVTTLLTGLGALFIAVEDIIGYFRGDDSLLGKMLEDSPLLIEFVDNLKLAFADLKDATAIFMAALQQMATGPILPNAIHGIGQLAHELAGLLKIASGLLYIFVKFFEVLQQLNDIVYGFSTFGMLKAILPDRFDILPNGGYNSPDAPGVYTPWTGRQQESLMGPTMTHVVERGLTNVHAPATVTVNSSNPTGAAALLLRWQLEGRPGGLGE